MAGTHVHTYAKAKPRHQSQLLGIEKPERVPNWDDNYEGFIYKDEFAFMKEAPLIDHLNLPIKLSYQKEGLYRGEKLIPALTFHKFMPRHGHPVVFVLEDARPEHFHELVRKIEDFYGQQAGEVSRYDNGNELNWSLGKERRKL